MKASKKIILTTLIFTIWLLSGCWNYREISELSLISGVAIDKNYTNNKFEISAEVVSFSITGKEAATNSRIVHAEGDTVFDAVRNIIKTSPKRLYWGHSQVYIISEALAEEGIIEVLDWLSRDQEPRSEATILISKEPTAGEILTKAAAEGKVVCFDIYQSLSSQRSLSKALKVEIYKFVNTLSSEGISPILPTISLVQGKEKIECEISGTAIFKQDKMIGSIDGEETKYLLFVNDEVKSAILVLEETKNTGHPNISLEIFKNKTKVKPDSLDDELIMQIKIKTQVAIAELGTSVDYIDEVKQKKLKTDAEKDLENNIKKLIKKIQNEYDSDVFGFGQLLRREMPEYWKIASSSWDEIFQELKVDVKVEIDIKNSAFLSKPIKIGE